MQLATVQRKLPTAGAETPLMRILRDHFVCADEATIAAVEAGAQIVQLDAGEVLFRQGERRDDVYLVVSGRLRASVAIATGHQQVLGEIGRGETTGELALFTGEPRSATVMALRDSTVARLPRALVQRAMMRDPELAFRLTRLVVERFRQAERQRGAPSVPVTVCVLPISPGVDSSNFAQALRAQQPPGARVAVLAASPVKPQHVEPAQWLDEIERSHAAVYLAADAADTDWTRFCLQHADEIVLLADASAEPSLSPVETKYLAPEAPLTIVKRTLVLLHGPNTKNPSGTARWLHARGRPRHVHLRPNRPADMSRMARLLSGRGVGLVLAGGGARGFAHLGVYTALEDAGIAVDFVGGTSIGALMGVLMALDVGAAELHDAVRDAFLKHPRGDITGDFNLLPLISLIGGHRSRDALMNSIRRFTSGEIDLEHTWKPFFVMASNFTAGTEETLSHGPLVPAVTASYAIPGALPPELIDGQLLFDGGTFNNFPVDVMARQGAGKIIGVDLSSNPPERLELAAMPSPLALLRDKLRPRHRQLYRNLPTIPETMITSSFITSLSRQREQRNDVDLLFRPDLPNLRLLDWRRFDEIVGTSREQASKQLSQMSDRELTAYR